MLLMLLDTFMPAVEASLRQGQFWARLISQEQHMIIQTHHLLIFSASFLFLFQTMLPWLQVLKCIATVYSDVDAQDKGQVDMTGLANHTESRPSLLEAKPFACCMIHNAGFLQVVLQQKLYLLVLSVRLQHPIDAYVWATQEEPFAALSL